MNEQLEADLKAAMLARDTLKVNVLKSLKNSLKNETIAKGRELDEDETLAIFKREAKQRDEAAALYLQGGSSDRAEQEKSERAIIDNYLPSQMNQAELAKVVDAVIAKIGQDPAKTGQIIGAVMSQTKGRADGQAVATLVKSKLS